MAAKIDSSKLSPAERLARKRAAARLRQQRCRARKRQAMLEKKRLESDQRRVVAHDACVVARPASVSLANHRPLQKSTNHPAFSPPKMTVVSSNSSTDSSSYSNFSERHQSQQNTPIMTVPPQSSSEHIYNCVSFESQRSFEEAQKSLRGAGGRPSTSLFVDTTATAVVSPSSSPPRHPVLIRDLSEEEALVPEEEAAVAAMLSLKTSTEKQPVASMNRDGEREQPPSSPSPPKEVRIVADAGSVTTSTAAAFTAHSQYPASSSSNSNSPSRAYHQHPPTKRPQQPRCMAPPHYEVYKYGPPRAPRRVTHPGYYGVPPPPLHPHIPHYSRGYYPATTARGFAVRYEYE
eukprot:CAMPEP_0178740800 /NCGR_PEP_ID=MMETSP0744-20121128/4785_1 /TAXON_ID=913974 /ORGANISM="Nitzschia punctata, Strain CCMP561" /LENGTH=347 /DNA_ID=CAMNT_0020393601 /DNA_START=119 /DNA_END=1162 /DNA_ORIENTATION=-